MIEKVTCYKCTWCGSIHEDREAAVKCLESHNLVYRIQEYVSSHDCWGKAEGDYKDTEIIFKEYVSAENYTQSHKGTIIKGVKLL